MKLITTFILLLAIPLTIGAQVNSSVQTQLQWSRTVSMPPIEIPSNITSSNLDGSFSAWLDQNKQLNLLISNTHMYRPFSIYMMRLDQQGNIPDSARIAGDEENVPEVLTFFKEHYYLRFRWWDEGTRKERVLALDTHFKAGTGSIPSGMNEAHPFDKGFVTMTAPLDSVQNIFGRSVPYCDSLVYLVKTDDFENAGAMVQLPVSSPILDHFAIASNYSSSAVFLNNTVLKGPDHHDIQIYYLDKNFKLKWHRQLTGASTLGMLQATDMTVNPDGDLIITGHSNDTVNFKAENIFDKVPEDVYAYSFIAGYSKTGKLKFLKYFDFKPSFTYERGEYSILESDETNITLYNIHEPKLVEYDIKSSSLTTIPIKLTTAEVTDQSKVLFKFISPEEFYRIQVVPGTENTNKPARYIIDKYVVVRH